MYSMTYFKALQSRYTYHFSLMICFGDVLFFQFLCLKNIRTFLSACCDSFGIKRSELFDAFDLFDVRDFGKVIKMFN